METLLRPRWARYAYRSIFLPFFLSRNNILIITAATRDVKCGFSDKIALLMEQRFLNAKDKTRRLNISLLLFNTNLRETFFSILMSLQFWRVSFIAK